MIWGFGGAKGAQLDNLYIKIFPECNGNNVGRRGIIVADYAQGKSTMVHNGRV